MEKIGAAAEAVAFLDVLEKQAAAEQLKQQDVSSFGVWKKPDPNEPGGGDYDGHAVGYAPYGLGAAQWMQRPAYGQSGAYAQHQANQAQDYAGHGAEGGVGQGYDVYGGMVGRGGPGYVQSVGISVEDGPGMSRNEEHNDDAYGGEQREGDSEYGRGQGGSDGKEDQSVGADGSSGKKRRSRWGPQEGEGDGNGIEGSGSKKKRKSRWAAEEPNVPLLGQIQLPDFVLELTERQALNIKLLDINQKLQTSMVLDPVGDGNRSPSPEPVYDNMGMRINTREYRAREKLTCERQEVIAMLIKKDPAFKPPANYKPLKHFRKLYIPVKEYPGYSFIGLVIGPRGNTQKRMEKETGAKIVIRGKGSVKEGRKRGLMPDPSENEDLHVLIEADTEDALEKAAGMVQKLLVPVEDGRNEHKKAQLQEIAVLNGTLRDDEYCRRCGEPGHRQYACPARHSTFKSDVSCRICGDGGHPTIDCPLKVSAQGNKMDDEYKNFLAELGGGGPEPPPRGSSSGNGGGSPCMGGSKCGGGKFNKDDNANLYVGCLPSTVDDEGLARLFAPFGFVELAKVIRDRLTGATKGYGFVKYAAPFSATAAVTHRNGYRLEGRVLAVRVAGPAPPPPCMGGGPGGPPQGGGDPMAPPPWIGPPGPIQQHNPYGPPPPGPNSYGPPHNSNAYGSPPPQGQGQCGGPPSGYYGEPYNNYAGGPPPQGGPQGQQGGMDVHRMPPHGPGMGGMQPGGMGPRPGPAGPVGGGMPVAGYGATTQYHGYSAPPPKNAPPAPPPSVSSGPATPPSWGGSNVGAPAPLPSGHSNAVESEYERFMSEMGR